MQSKPNHQVLTASGIYFFLCGVSAIFWPASWYFVCGLENQGLNPFLTLAGVMMASLGVASYLSASLRDAGFMLVALIVANLGDAGAVTFYASQGMLPSLNAIVFICIDLTWAWFLIRALRSTTN